MWSRGKWKKDKNTEDWRGGGEGCKREIDDGNVKY